MARWLGTAGRTRSAGSSSGSVPASAPQARHDLRRVVEVLHRGPRERRGAGDVERDVLERARIERDGVPHQDQRRPVGGADQQRAQQWRARQIEGSSRLLVRLERHRRVEPVGRRRHLQRHLGRADHLAPRLAVRAGREPGAQGRVGGDSSRQSRADGRLVPAAAQTRGDDDHGQRAGRIEAVEQPAAPLLRRHRLRVFGAFTHPRRSAHGRLPR
ncbi:MAG: hypothetical protein WKG00_31970 [Polyangiaceae bacterium]